MNYTLCFIIAICFAIWPILLNKSGNPNMSLGAIIIAFFTVIPMLIYHLATVPQKFEMPIRFFWIAVGIGMINGLGMILYSQLIRTTNPGMYVSIIAIIMPIFALVLGYFIIGQPTITFTKIIGILLAVAGVYLMTMTKS